MALLAQHSAAVDLTTDQVAVAVAQTLGHKHLAAMQAQIQAVAEVAARITTPITTAATAAQVLLLLDITLPQQLTKQHPEH